MVHSSRRLCHLSRGHIVDARIVPRILWRHQVWERVRT